MVPRGRAGPRHRRRLQPASGRAERDAARHGQVDVVRLLIERGALLDHTAKYGLSAIMLAVINGYVEIVRLLAQAGADLALRGSGAPGFHDRTALDLAEARGDAAMIEVLHSRASS